MKDYIGITVGPIVPTLMMARKPRELFSASYLFSYWVRSVLSRFAEKQNAVRILSPVYDPSAPSDVGLYPDRIFLQLVDMTFGWDGVLKNVFDTFKTELFGKDSDKDLDEFSDEFLDRYFKMSTIRIRCADDRTAVRTLNRLLDGVELSNTAIPNERRNPVSDLVRKRSNSDSLLFKKAFGKSRYPVPSLAEIAIARLLQINADVWKQVGPVVDDQEDDFYVKIKKCCPNEFRSYHKYICVVQADGDNMGATVNAMADGRLADFSKDLMQFDRQACEEIKAFGGLPIYAGGDDLLFIAPVVGSHGGSVFDLLEKIDSAFRKAMFDGDRCKYPVDTVPSMSYGVSITYYKYPLYEALKQAQRLLFETAKSVSGKNAIAWTLQKHSGSSVSCSFNKSDSLREAFKKVIETVGTEKESDYFISLVAHKIRSNRTMLEVIAESDRYAERLKNFFERVLDTQRKSESEKEYLDRVYDLCVQSIASCSKSNSETETGKSDTANRGQWIETVYGLLRTVKFINGLESDEE